jgi:hypothetical protein
MQKAIGGGRPRQVMDSGNSPSFDLVEEAFRELGRDGGVPEAHGGLCGLACILGVKAGPLWLTGLVGEAEASTQEGEACQGVLGPLAEGTCAALADGDMSFELLLPPDEAPLAVRTEGLAQWCAGFLHGLGEGAGNTASRDALEGDVAREIMADFGEIARVTLDDEETDLEAETAYAELVEFVRVSVQLLFEDLGNLRQRLAAASVH